MTIKEFKSLSKEEKKECYKDWIMGLICIIPTLALLYFSIVIEGMR